MSNRYNTSRGRGKPLAIKSRRLANKWDKLRTLRIRNIARESQHAKVMLDKAWKDKDKIIWGRHLRAMRELSETI